MLRLRYPNGALSPPVAAPITLGRGNPPCIADPHCSRAQFQLSPATDDSPGRSALRLQAVGAHGVVLERRMQRATAGGSPSASATAAAADDGCAWELAGFLEVRCMSWDAWREEHSTRSMAPARKTSLVSRVPFSVAALCNLHVGMGSCCCLGAVMTVC